MGVFDENCLWISHSGKIGTWTKVAYGLPGFATTSLSFLISVYANDFYSLLGVGLSFLSFFTALARSFDVLTDPLMGWFSDRTRTTYGRRRPFMASGCIFYALLFVLLFTPPDGGGKIATAWFATFYPVFYLFDTYTNVPYEALGPELSDDYNERNQIFFTAKIFNFLGMLVAAGAPACITFILRQAENEHLDCRSMFTIDSPPGVSQPKLPEYIDQRVCRDSADCDGSAGRVCFLEVFSPDNDRKYYELELENLNDQCSKVDLEPELLDCFGRNSSVCETPEAADEEVCVAAEVFDISYLNAQKKSFFFVSLVFGIYFVSSVWNCVLSIQERKMSEEAKITIPLVPSILRAFKNRAFKPLLAAWALDGLALSALVTMFPFFIRYVVISDGVKANEGGYAMDPMVCMGISVMGLLITAMASAPVWLIASNKFGKYNAWILYNLVNVFTNLLFFIPAEGDPGQTIAVMMLNGIPVGGQFLTNSVLADVIDYDEFLNGSRSEGSFSVFATLIPKFVAIPASALPLAVVNLLGFEPPIDGVAQEQKDNVKMFIRMTFVLLPLLAASFGFIIKIFFPIKTAKILAQIQDGIAKHERKEPAVDPLTGHTIKLMELTPEETDTVWLYENFSSSCLQFLKDQGTAKPIVVEMALYFVIGTLCTTGFLLATILTFKFVSDRKLAIIPIAMVILFGMSLSFMLLNMLRFFDALRLSRSNFSVHSDLIGRLMVAKASGQRSGAIGETPIIGHWFQVIDASRKEQIASKYGSKWLARIKRNRRENPESDATTGLLSHPVEDSAGGGTGGFPTV
ncbi:unnamed protein product [Ostreobium quekettii]|uniref:Uncharacterized protein n=1 Tax=Ostreobium quekettii TaxID=121088 RepID=A0A8S1ITA3_9CHLO|nr:unnamed protein product [Ostreobium quekettii]|eukprot:evm.model.scf_958.4 EVM.evm.TU.scf_958.4   scf_958:43747-57941(-)